MIAGTVTESGVPIVMLSVGGKLFAAILDTGFNGELELPGELHVAVNARFVNRTSWMLAAGQLVEQDSFAVEFPFDGQTVKAEATFAPGREILIGTLLLARYRLEINFPARTVLLEQVG